jgi:hypothetical protein
LFSTKIADQRVKNIHRKWQAAKNLPKTVSSNSAWRELLKIQVIYKTYSVTCTIINFMFFAVELFDKWYSYVSRELSSNASKNVDGRGDFNVSVEQLLSKDNKHEELAKFQELKRRLYDSVRTV